MFQAATPILGAMDVPKKSKLDQDQQADAARLKSAWDEYRAAGGLKQDEFAVEHGLKSQSNMGHYLHGRQPLNLRSATAFAKGMRVPIERLSPSIVAEVEEAIPILRAASESQKLPGSLLDLNGIEGQLVMFFRGLPADAQAHVLTDLNNEFNRHHRAPSSANPYAFAPPPTSHELGKGRETTESSKNLHIDTDMTPGKGFHGGGVVRPQSDRKERRDGTVTHLAKKPPKAGTGG